VPQEAVAESLAKAPLLYLQSSRLFFQQEIALTDLLAVEALSW
jgi:hypothetical protein